MGSIFLLAGPSGVGKGPLWRTITRSFPDIAARTQKVILHTDRAPRPHEREGVDYYFREAVFFDGIDAANAIALAENVPSPWIRFDVRSDCRSALNLYQLRDVANDPQRIGFLECYYTLVPVLKAHPLLSGFPVTSVFLSPLSARDIETFRPVGPDDTLSRFIESIMLRKLIYRRVRQHGPDDLLIRYIRDMMGPQGSARFHLLCSEDHLTGDPPVTLALSAMENVLRRHTPLTNWGETDSAERRAVELIIINLMERAVTASAELLTAPTFDWVIPNDAGESHTDWGREEYQYLGAAALRPVDQMLALLRGEIPPYAEKWDEDLVAGLR